MELTDRFKQALLLMFELHSNQNRKGTKISYVSTTFHYVLCLEQSERNGNNNG